MVRSSVGRRSRILPESVRSSNDSVPLAVRHLLALLFAVAIAWSGTVSIAWAEAMGFGNCGPRWGVTCEVGRDYLTAGLLAFFVILLIHAKIFGGVTGWRGPDTELFFVVFVVPLGGSIAFGSHVFKGGHSVLWQLLMAGLALALIVPVAFVVGSLFRDASGVCRAYFWCLRVKWEDKTPGPMERILVQPKTPREKNHRSLFLAGRVLAYGVGCSLGLSYIAAVT